MTDDELGRLERDLGYAFTDRTVLVTALTHASWTNERHEPHNQRLEFLGDAVLQLVISVILYHRVTGDEGQLTAVRQELVKGAWLGEVARRLDLGPLLRMSRAARNDRVEENPDALEDAFEALMGAVFLDGGIEAARRVVEHVLTGRIDALVAEAASGRVRYENAKSRLHERCEAQWKQTPRYVLISEAGASHARWFEMEVELPDGRRYPGAGRRKKEAEAAAAAHALRELG